MKCVWIVCEFDGHLDNDDMTDGSVCRNVYTQSCENIFRAIIQELALNDDYTDFEIVDDEDCLRGQVIAFVGDNMHESDPDLHPTGRDKLPVVYVGCLELPPVSKG